MNFCAKEERFPCPVCGEALKVRQSKKDKPYLVCDPCGLQMFVRNATGIRRFERLVAEAQQRNIWERLEDLQKRYRKTCPRCGKAFWLAPGLVKTSWVDGSFEGYRCPEPDCDGVAEMEENE